MGKLIILFCLILQLCQSIRINEIDDFQQEFSMSQTDQTCGCVPKSGFSAWGSFCTGQCNNQTGCGRYSVYCQWSASQGNTTVTCLNNCSGHGTCNNGVCSCQSGWKGTDCSQQLYSCLNNCNSKGTCNTSNGVCQCNSGYSGSDCSIVVLTCPNSCSGKGVCNTSTGICTCNTGYSGSNCSLMTCSNNCSTHGACNTSNGVCICQNGWSGSDCSVQVLPCPSNCSGKGVCNTVTGTCTCNSGYTGSNCGTAVTLSCPNNCSGKGTCNTTTGVCTCNTGFGGSDCTTVFKSCSNNCGGNGICNTNTGICACNQYYSGADCSIFNMPCLNNCTSHGTCNTQTGVCSCSSGWTGSDCSTNSTQVQNLIQLQQAIYVPTWKAWDTNDILALFKPACMGLAQQLLLAYAQPDLNNGLTFAGQSPNCTVNYQNVNQNSKAVYKYASQNLYSSFGIQTLISVGGWTLSVNTFNFLGNTLTSAQVLAWAQKVKSVVDAYGAQGIDIDFESTNQSIWYNLLQKNNIFGALRQAMPSPYKIRLTMPYGAAINMNSAQIASSFNPTIAAGWGAQAATALIQQNWNDIDSFNLMTYGSESNLDPTQAINLARQSINSILGINNAQIKLNMGGLIGMMSTCSTGWCNWQTSHATTAANYVKNNSYHGFFWWPESGNFSNQLAYYQASFQALNGKAATPITLAGVC